MSSDDEGPGVDLFQEPEGYYQPEKPPTYATHRLLSGEELRVRLVGFNPLWGHHLWNAGRTICDFLESSASARIAGKTVLELGAGAGLPSLVCGLRGARQVVVTDYPDAELVDNLRWNAEHSIAELAKPTSTSSSSSGNIAVEGYLWGADPAPLLAHLDGGEEEKEKGFDVLILADLLFNHSEHGKLVQSIRRTLARRRDAVAYVFFTPYRPWLLEKDLAFFDLARSSEEGGFAVTKIGETVMEKVMFEEDPGDELLRRTVYSYELRWADLVEQQ